MCWFITLLVLGIAAGTLPAGESMSFGVAPTPRNFPAHSREDIQDMFKRSAELGSHAMFIYQWSQADLFDVAGNMTALAKAQGLTVTLSLSPTKLDKRGEPDLPQALRERCAPQVSFANPLLSAEFSAAAVRLASLKPAYLCLATEINFLAIADIKEYVAFAAACHRAYPLIKAASPQTQVYVSFQWDIFRLMDTREPAKIDEHSKLIDVFRPALDTVAFTSYPAEITGTPAAMPPDYYAGILRHVKASDTVIFSELGWPSGGKGSEAQQAEFIRRLPALMEKVRPKVVVWSLLHDVNHPALGVSLSSTGLRTSRGEEKAAWSAWRRLRQ